MASTATDFPHFIFSSVVYDLTVTLGQKLTFAPHIRFCSSLFLSTFLVQPVVPPYFLVHRIHKYVHGYASMYGHTNLHKFLDGFSTSWLLSIIM